MDETKVNELNDDQLDGVTGGSFITPVDTPGTVRRVCEGCKKDTFASRIDLVPVTGTDWDKTPYVMGRATWRCKSCGYTYTEMTLIGKRH